MANCGIREAATLDFDDGDDGMLEVLKRVRGSNPLYATDATWDDDDDDLRNLAEHDLSSDVLEEARAGRRSL